MKNRLLAVIMSLVLVFAFAGCQKEKAAEDAPVTKATTTAAATKAASITETTKEATKEATTKATTKKAADKIADVAGTYTAEDSSSLVIKKDGSAEVGIFRLTSMEGKVTEVKDGVVYITLKDANNGDMKLTFNTNTKVLTVTDSTWQLLPNGEKFTLDK